MEHDADFDRLFEERIATREATIGIVGLGYAGLPLAMAFAEAGFDVTGVDLDPERVEAVNERPLLSRRRARRALRRPSTGGCSATHRLRARSPSSTR